MRLLINILGYLAFCAYIATWTWYILEIRESKCKWRDSIKLVLFGLGVTLGIALLWLIGMIMT